MSVKSIAKKAFKANAITEEEYKQLLSVIKFYYESLKPQDGELYFDSKPDKPQAIKKCNKCGYFLYCYVEDGKLKFDNYCPNCGEKQKEKPMTKPDFLIATGPRRSGKTTELIKAVCKINREEGRNVAVIICWSHADARNIASKADDLGFHDMPFPITVKEILQASGYDGRGSFYKYAFFDDLDRIAQALISRLRLQLRGFNYTWPSKESDNGLE